MTDEQAKSISIKDYLRSQGIYPAKEYFHYGMYLSPYRNERHPSLRVDYKENLWIDFGTDKGGSIIDLVMKLKQCTFSQAKKYLNTYSNNDPDVDKPDPFSFHRNNLPVPSGMMLTEVKELQHRNLITYLQERKINIAFAKEYCKEVHYRINGRNYYAIGFENNLAGYALRNPGFKSCISPNFITTFDHQTSDVNLLEGFIDYLSLLTMQPEQKKISAVVLNSTANLEKSLLFLSRHTKINAYLDNDEAGIRARVKLYSLRLPIKDLAKLYENYKDLNDFLVGKKLETKQEINEKQQSKPIIQKTKRLKF